MIRLAVFVPVALSMTVPFSRAQDPAPESIPLQFAWPREGEVRVREVKFKKGHEVELTYRAVLAPDEATGGIRVDQTDFVAHRFDQTDLSTPDMKPMRDQFAAADAFVPTMKIGPDGEFLEFEGWDAAIDRMVEFMKTLAASPDRARGFEEFARSPKYRPMLEAKIAETWNLWAGAVIYLEVAVGEEEEMELEQPVGIADLSVPMIVRRSCERRFQDRGVDCVEITVTHRADPEKLAEVMREFFSKHVEKPIAEEEMAAMQMRRTSEIRGVWEVATLRPHRVEYEMKVEVEGAPEGAIEGLERRRFEFDWPDLGE